MSRDSNVNKQTPSCLPIIIVYVSLSFLRENEGETHVSRLSSGENSCLCCYYCLAYVCHVALPSVGHSPMGYDDILVFPVERICANTEDRMQET